jgi:hypothetical protein
MMENPLNLSLTQGQKFIQFQNKTKKTILEHKNVKEGFIIQEQNIINPDTISNSYINSIKNEDKKTVIKINSMKERYNILVNQYKEELKNIENKLSMNNTVDINSNIQMLNSINGELINLGNEISNEMEILYKNNYELYKKVNLNSDEFNKSIKIYEDISMRIKNLNREGLQNMSSRDLNSLVNDTDVYILYENYNYVLWGILAITTLTITMKLLK